MLHCLLYRRLVKNVRTVSLDGRRPCQLQRLQVSNGLRVRATIAPLRRGPETQRLTCKATGSTRAFEYSRDLQVRGMETVRLLAQMEGSCCKLWQVEPLASFCRLPPDYVLQVLSRSASWIDQDCPAFVREV